MRILGLGILCMTSERGTWRFLGCLSNQAYGFNYNLKTGIGDGKQANYYVRSVGAHHKRDVAV